MTEATASKIAVEMGIDPANAIGTAEHRAKWLGKLRAAGFDAKTARSIFTRAMEARHAFCRFDAAVKAIAGTEDGIRTAPRPGKAAKWNR